MCDCLVALPRASASGVTLLAKNSDRPPDEAQHLEWLPPRRDERSLKVTYMQVAPAPGHTIGVVGSRPWWMWGLEHGVNEAGVAIGNEAIFTTLDPHGLPARLIGMDLVRLGLERGESAHAAIEVMIGLLERYGQGGSGHYGVDDPYWSSFLVADHGEAWVLETSGREWALERVQRVRAISNRTTIPAFDAAHRDPAMPTEVVTDPRLRASHAVLAADPVTVSALRAHLRDHTSGDGGFSMYARSRLHGHHSGIDRRAARAVSQRPPSCPCVPRPAVYLDLRPARRRPNARSPSRLGPLRRPGHRDWAGRGPCDPGGPRGRACRGSFDLCRLRGLGRGGVGARRSLLAGVRPLITRPAACLSGAQVVLPPIKAGGCVPTPAAYDERSPL